MACGTAATQTKYGPYPAYKPSNTEWLGDIPDGWLTIQIGRLYRRIKRTGFINRELLSVYRDHGVVPKSSRDDNNNKASEDLTPYQLVKKNDLVLNKMKTWQGAIAVSDFEGIVSPAYFVYQPEEKLFEVADPKYVHFLVRNPMYIAQYLRRSKGIRVSQWDLDPGEFQRIELLLPPIPEQIKIAAFLDHETAKIDALIAKQQRLIALLEEKRQAVISHAVTKGLEPTAPLRPSGIDWLGEVPAHWEVMKLKHVVSVKGGYAFSSESFTDSGKKVIRIGDIDTRGNVSLENAKCIPSSSANQFHAYEVRIGHILMAMTGATIGKAGWYLDQEPALLNQRVGAFECDDAKIAARFFWYVLKSEGYQKYVTLTAFGGAQPNISDTQMLNYPFVLPNPSEQDKIANFLDDENVRFDKLADKAQLAIILLKERRTALISAAVTGKIDVRDWQPLNPISSQDLEASEDIFA